jgi:hypothetical protein
MHFKTNIDMTILKTKLEPTNQPKTNTHTPNPLVERGETSMLKHYLYWAVVLLLLMTE